MEEWVCTAHPMPRQCVSKSRALLARRTAPQALPLPSRAGVQSKVSGDYSGEVAVASDHGRLFPVQLLSRAWNMEEAGPCRSTSRQPSQAEGTVLLYYTWVRERLTKDRN